MLLRLFGWFIAFWVRLLGARRRVLELPGGVSLAYAVAGPPAGEPWVLLHGMGSTGAGWLAVIAALRRDCRLIVPELSGLGGTRAPGGGLGVQQAADAVAKLIEIELGDRPATVCGLSLGGWSAVRLALGSPERVSRLVLVDAGGYRDQDWDRISQLVTVHDLADVDRLYTALFARTPWVLRHSKRTFLAAYTSPGVKKVLGETAERDAYDDADLASLAMPVALIWGQKDGIFPLSTAWAMLGALGGGQSAGSTAEQVPPRLIVIPNAGHTLHWECPRRLVAALLAIRRDLPPRTERPRV